MTIDLTCQKCEGSFELDVQALIDGGEKLACPNCNAKAPGDLADDFTAALSELILQTEKLSKRFLVSIAFESDDLAEAKEEEDDEDDVDADVDEDALDDDDDADDDEDDDDEGFNEDPDL
jgi:hypothetical protein